jgi:hypothetical protein
MHTCVIAKLTGNPVMKVIQDSGMVENPPPVVDSLFFKIQGDDDAVRLAAKTIEVIVKRHGSDYFQFAGTDEQARDLWDMRKHALWAVLNAAPGSRGWTTDVWWVPSCEGLLLRRLMEVRGVVSRYRDCLSSSSLRSKIIEGSD